MATEMIKRYPLKYFKEREKNIENLQNILSDKTIEIINNLAQHVGAPEYQRTPIFKKEDKFKRRPNTQSTTIEDWEAMRNFKPTVLAKSEEDIDKEINEIRILLNKITNNYCQARTAAAELAAAGPAPVGEVSRGADPDPDAVSAIASLLAVETLKQVRNECIAII